MTRLLATDCYQSGFWRKDGEVGLGNDCTAWIHVGTWQGYSHPLYQTELAKHQSVLILFRIKNTNGPSDEAERIKPRITEISKMYKILES